MPPLTIDEIKARREELRRQEYKRLLDWLEKSGWRAASLSEPNDHTTVINIPPPPEALTVVSWNVQTFEAGKSLGNPFVNKVIQRVLAALDADICILLESRAESYVNMNAIETGLEGQGGWKKVVEEGDEEDGDDDEQDDEVMSIDVDADEDQLDSSVDVGGELTYVQNVSEMTGKRWAPPKVIHVYHGGVSASCADIKLVQRIGTLEGKLARGGKLTKKEAKTLDTLTKRRDNKLKADPYSLDPAMGASSEEKKFASSYGYQPKLLKWMCQGDLGATQDWLVILHGDEHKPTRDYYNLYFTKKDWTEVRIPWGTDLSAVSPDQNGRFLLRLKRCLTCNEHLGVGTCDACEELGPYTTNLENLRQAVDDITFFMSTCQESYSILLRSDHTLSAGSDRGIWLHDKLVSAKTNAARLLMRARDQLDITSGKVVLKAGRILGYQDKTLGFYGRCPYLLPIELWLPYLDVSRNLYMVAFHGPFGASTKAGVDLRAAAMRELLNAGVGRDSRLGDEPHVMILGDFNLDWAPDEPKPDAYQQIANALYKDFEKQRLYPLIGGGVATSLISIHGSSKWQGVPPTIESYTSSSYDNCFLRGDDVRDYASAAVIDVISWIEDNLADFDLPESDPQHDKLGALPPKTQAFYIYRKYVSDHLPILCDILVAPVTPRMRRIDDRLREERKVEEERRIVWIGSEEVRSANLVEFNVSFAYDQMIELDRTDETDRYDRETAEDGSITGIFVGEVDRHQDDHLILRCASAVTDHVAWLSFQWADHPKANAHLLRLHPPGTRMRWVVKNPRPVG